MVMFMPTLGLSWGNGAGTVERERDGGQGRGLLAANCFQLCCMLLPFLWPVADVSPVPDVLLPPLLLLVLLVACSC